MEVKIYNNGSHNIIKCDDIKYGHGALYYDETENFVLEYGINQKKILIPDRYFFDIDFDKICVRANNGEHIPVQWLHLHTKDKRETLVFNSFEDKKIEWDKLNASTVYIMYQGKTIDRIKV